MIRLSNESDPKDHIDSVERVRRRKMLWLLVGAVAVWGVMLAIGSYLGIDEQTPSRDVRRFAVMAGASAAFLAMWVGAIFMSKRH